MSSKKIGNVYAELTVRDKMSKGIKNAGKSLTSLAKTSVISMGAVAAATATALAVGAKGAISMVAEIEEMSQQAGVGVAALMNLQQAYRDGGLDAAGAGKDIAKMQKAIDGVASGDIKKDPFAQLGLSAQELLNLSPEESFQRIGKELLKIENATTRNAIAMQIFGKSGSKLITVFGELASGEKRLGRMPELAQKFAAAMGEADDIMGRMKTKQDQFFVGFSAGIIGELLPQLQKVDEHDFTTLGENLGKAIAIGFKGLTDGTLLEIAGLKMDAWILDIGVGILNEMNSIIAPIIALIGAAFEALVNKSKNVWADLKFGITGNAAEHDKQIKSRSFQRTFKDSFNDRNIGDEPIINTVGNEMRAEADRLFNGLAQSVEEGLTKAAAISAPMRKQGDDLPQLTPQTKEVSWEAARSAVNSMQSKGLGMGREGVADKVKEQSKILEQIRDLIKAGQRMEIPATF